MARCQFSPFKMFFTRKRGVWEMKKNETKCFWKTSNVLRRSLYKKCT